MLWTELTALLSMPWKQSKLCLSMSHPAPYLPNVLVSPCATILWLASDLCCKPFRHARDGYGLPLYVLFRGDYSAALAATVDALPGMTRRQVIAHSRWHADLMELDMRRWGNLLAVAAC